MLQLQLASTSHYLDEHSTGPPAELDSQHCVHSSQHDLKVTPGSGCISKAAGNCRSICC
jgi:hypothetical protein